MTGQNDVRTKLFCIHSIRLTVQKMVHTDEYRGLVNTNSAALVGRSLADALVRPSFRVKSDAHIMKGRSQRTDETRCGVLPVSENCHHWMVYEFQKVDSGYIVSGRIEEWSIEATTE